MNLLILSKQNAVVELLISDGFDIGLITANADALFEHKQTLEKAMKDFMADHSAELMQRQPVMDELKAAGVIGYPVTPAKDARLYAADKGITIGAELEIDCG